MMTPHTARSAYRLAVLVFDSLALTVAFVLAQSIADHVASARFQPLTERNGLAAMITVPGLLALLWARGAYSPHRLLDGPEEYARVISGCTYGTLLVVIASYVSDTPLLSRGWLLLFWFLSLVLTLAGRYALRRVARGLRRNGYFVRRVLIAGVGDQGLAIAEQLHAPAQAGCDVVGFLDDYLALGTRVQASDDAREFTVIGHPRNALAVARQHACDLLIVVPAALSWESQQALARVGAASGPRLEVRLAPTAYDLNAGPAQPAPLHCVPLLRVRSARIVGIEAMLRTTLDAILSLLMLLLVSPAVVCILLAARLRGVRHMFEVREVLGQGGRHVSLPLLVPRVTDSLLLRGFPALLVVLRGEMALVGPRPLPVQDAPEYRRWSGLLLSVKPGLTGPWRLAGAEVSPEDRVLLDVWWVRNWSLWQHVFVLARSCLAALSAGPQVHKLERWQAPAVGSHTVGEAAH